MARNAFCVLLLSTTVLATGCATPDAPDPKGKWKPINQFSEVPQAIPLQQTYVYQPTPADGTLKAMLSRWAKDSKMSLSYLHPNDYTLYGPVANIRTRSLDEAAAALSAAYAGQRVQVAVERSQIIVRYARDAASAAPSAGTPSASSE